MRRAQLCCLQHQAKLESTHVLRCGSGRGLEEAPDTQKIPAAHGLVNGERERERERERVCVCVREIETKRESGE